MKRLVELQNIVYFRRIVPAKREKEWGYGVVVQDGLIEQYEFLGAPAGIEGGVCWHSHAIRCLLQRLRLKKHAKRLRPQIDGECRDAAELSIVEQKVTALSTTTRPCSR